MAKLDQDYNVLYLLALVVLSGLLVNTIVKEKKKQAKLKDNKTTPISDAIAAIKTGQVKVTQIPDTI